VNSLASKRTTINYDEAKVRPYTLPDLFTLTGGGKSRPRPYGSNSVGASCLDLFRRHVYGFAPPKPETLTFRVVESNPQAMGGKANPQTRGD